MSVVVMESQCMKTTMIHLVDKSDFILSDHKTRCKSLQLFQLILQSLRTVIFPALKEDFLSWQKLLATIFFQKKSVK